jgi:hypothetical protein
VAEVILCQYILAWVAGRWAWIRNSDSNPRGGRECVLPVGHVDLNLPHRTTPLPEEPASTEAYTELARLRAVGDPERDARREAYADRERRKAARALDRFMELHVDDIDVSTGDRARVVAGEHFVEAVGDYVLSRLQQKSHYGAPTPDDDPCRPLPGGGWHCVPWKPCAKPGGCLFPDGTDE